MWPWGSAIACATSATPHAGRPPPTSSATIAQIWAPIWVQDMPAKCCPAPCTFKARAEGLAQLKPAQAASCVWCPHRRQRTDPAVFIAVDDLNLYYGNAGTAALALKYKTFRRKTYLPKACNFHVQMPGSLNCRMKHARRMFTRHGLGAALLAARWVWPWEAKKEKFHTCGGPRRRPCLGQGRGRRIRSRFTIVWGYTIVSSCLLMRFFFQPFPLPVPLLPLLKMFSF